MLTDHQVEEAASQLQDFQLESGAHLKKHDDFLQKYAQLLEDYKRLRSDYEEERDSREKYKQLAKAQERNPFVLVLIDGDGIIFEDDLIRSGADGGSRAAQMLNDAVRKSLRSRGLDHCRVVVRIYANMAGLSKALSKTGLVGPEKRSLAPFVANFNRSNELFDFVDAGELKENADFKIRAAFRQFVDVAQCKHIYFAACHDVGYISELTPHMTSRDRITLVRTNAFQSFHQEFARLGLRVEDFPNIFRNTPLQTEGGTFTKTVASPPPPVDHHTTPSADNGVVCSFYQKGLCRYGKTCKFVHVKASNGNTAWNKETSPNKLNVFGTAKSDNDFMNGRHSADTAPPPVDLVAQLPDEEAIPPNMIPVNKNHQRIDPLLPVVSHEERAAFQSRVTTKKLCNNFHLIGSCQSGEACDYDHKPITAGMLKQLKWIARSNMPCPKRGSCRSSTCIHGHVCQKSDCKHRGGKAYCKLGFSAHSMDLHVAEYVAAKDSPKGTEKKTTIDDNPLSPVQGNGIQESESGDESEGMRLRYEDSDGDEVEILYG